MTHAQICTCSANLPAEAGTAEETSEVQPVVVQGIQEVDHHHVDFAYAVEGLDIGVDQEEVHDAVLSEAHDFAQEVDRGVAKIADDLCAGLVVQMVAD
jgi:hypothetical protein